MAPLNTRFIQPFCDLCVALAPECQPEDLPHHLGLLGDDFRLQPIQPVAVGHGGGGEDPLLHPHPDAGAHIAGVGGGLHLGEGRVDGGGLLGGQLPGVHVLLLEVDGDAQPQQLPHKVQGVLGVPGEPGDGLDQDAVDFSGPAVRHHPVELVPLPGAQAGNALVRVDVGQLPVRVLPDMAGVVVHLGQIGVELVRRVAADPGVGGHPELGLFLGGGADDGHFYLVLHGASSFPATTIPQPRPYSYLGIATRSGAGNCAVYSVRFRTKTGLGGASAPAPAGCVFPRPR